jgi:hypothetical protein
VMARRKEYGHLPAGRVPGPQTRKGGGIGRSGFVAKAIGVLMIAAAIVFYIFGMTCGPDEESCAPPLMLGLAGTFMFFGLLVAWIGQVVDRRKRRRNASHLQLALPRDTFLAGETIAPQLTITNMQRLEGDVEVGLVCTVFYDYEYRTYTQHGSATSRQTKTATTFENWAAAQRIAEPQTFTFAIPPDAPYSHEGSAVSYAWKVTVRERRRGLDRFTDLPFWVEAWA